MVNKCGSYLSMYQVMGSYEEEPKAVTLGKGCSMSNDDD